MTPQEKIIRYVQRADRGLSACSRLRFIKDFSARGLASNYEAYLCGYYKGQIDLQEKILAYLKKPRKEGK